jgi:hypothetical protein
VAKALSIGSRPLVGAGGMRAVRKYAASSSETVDLSGLGLGTIRKTICVFNGAHATDPIGNTSTNDGNSRKATINGLALTASTSHVLAIVQTRDISTDRETAETPSLPTGMTNVGLASSYRACRVGPQGTFTSKSSTVETSPAGPAPGDPLPTVRWVTISVEVLAA